MEVALRESSVEAASPVRRARSAPRDTDDPATTRNKERDARRHGADAWAPRMGSPVAQVGLERDLAVRETEGEPATQKKAKTAQQESVKASGLRMGSPAPWFDPESCGENLWMEVAKHISGSDIIRLSGACRWLLSILADDSIWRYAFFRELQLLDNFTSKKLLDNDFSFGYPLLPNLHPSAIESDSHHCPNWYWHQVYIANELHGLFCNNDEFSFHGFIMGASDLLLTASPPAPILSLRHAVESMGICIFTDARPGVWIIGTQVMKCPGCVVADCEGSTQVLEARHCELLLDVDWDSLLLEDLGQYLVDNEIDRAFCGIFNCEHLDSLSTAGVVNMSSDGFSRIGERKDLLTRSRKCQYAAAINTNVQRNQGLLSKFEALRDKRNGQVVCVRIKQMLDTEGE